MNEIQALLLGLIQGLSEYLPISSSGHLQIGQTLLGIDPEVGGLTFDIVVHVATVLSTLVILWKEVSWLLVGFFKKEYNEEKKYILNILISMFPIGIVGLCFKDQVEALFHGTTVVGFCLLITGILLALTYYIHPKEREKISPLHAFIIGLAQACAVLPGLSRSGSTIATGLLLGNSKKNLAQFSFLMVIPPILGEALLDAKHIFAPSADYLAEHGATQPISTTVLLVGFIAAFISGCFACKWMIALVKKCKLIYFAIYCMLVGALTLIFL